MKQENELEIIGDVMRKKNIEFEEGTSKDFIVNRATLTLVAEKTMSRKQLKHLRTSLRFGLKDHIHQQLSDQILALMYEKIRHKLHELNVMIFSRGLHSHQLEGIEDKFQEIFLLMDWEDANE